MLIKYRSLMLLIRIRTGHFSLAIPFPLFVIDQTLEAISNLGWLWEKLAPVRPNHCKKDRGGFNRISSRRIPAGVLYETCRLSRPDTLLNGLYIPGFWLALATALLVSASNIILQSIFADN